jgi:hypothetical protein
MTASSRWRCVPWLAILISSRLMKPSIILSMVKCEPLNWLTAIGTGTPCQLLSLAGQEHGRPFH